MVKSRDIILDNFKLIKYWLKYLFLYAWFLTCSGLVSQFVREKRDQESSLLTAELSNQQRRPWDKRRRAKAEFPLTRFARASLEGATQVRGWGVVLAWRWLLWYRWGVAWWLWPFLPSQ